MGFPRCFEVIISPDCQKKGKEKIGGGGSEKERDRLGLVFVFLFGLCCLQICIDSYRLKVF